MPELVIEKQHNPVMDLSIAYGLFYVLDTNDANPVLHNYPSAYVIRYDAFDVEDVFIYPPEEGWVNFGRFLNPSNRDKMMATIYGTNAVESALTVDGTFETLLSYYQTPVPERTDEHIPKHAKKKHWTNIIGTWYGGKGQRTSGNANTGYRAHLFEKWLAELGFIQSVSFTSIKENDFLLWMGVPSEDGLSEIRLFDRIRKDKETDETKRSHTMRSHSVEVALAQIHLGIQRELQTSNIKEEYDGALFMRGWFNGNTGSADRVTTKAFYPFSESTITRALLHFETNPRDKKVDFQHALSTWLVNDSQQGFHDTVAVITKEDRWVNSLESEDYMTLAGISGLHHNDGVQRLGRTLNVLLFNKRGYGLTIDLMDVHTTEDLMQAVTQMAVDHEKLTQGRYPMWHDGEYDAFLEVVDNVHYSPKDIASAILLKSKTRREKKETN